jgi:hypothetical protein
MSELEGERMTTNDKSEQAKVAATGGANAPERLPDWMRRNHEAVQVPIRPSSTDLCEVYGSDGKKCYERAVEFCGRRDARLCAIHLKEDAGCQANHRTLAGRLIFR